MGLCMGMYISLVHGYESVILENLRVLLVYTNFIIVLH
uniref:Uncharacterized protein n=1 Tax=Myoviridae sp. ctwmI4 TaxID=2826710 RepID=A0A8S5LUK9_9CAUD|nr:MAG TPA: hypothetical protein [Myoviridae sp. ctwmI4]